MKFVGSGEEITAETIRYKFERAFGVGASDNWVSNTAGVFSLDQITVDGEYDLTITLENPNPLFGPLMRDQDFGIVDPVEVAACVGGPEISRLGAYTLGFFSFWVLTSSSCLLAIYFNKPCPQVKAADSN